MRPTARLVVAGVLSALILVSIAALATAGTKGSSSAAQYQYGKKVTICHKGKNTITISVNALPAHQAHGDTVGACATGHKANKGKRKGASKHAPNPGTPTTTTTTTTTTAAPPPSHGNGNGNGNGNGKKK